MTESISRKFSKLGSHVSATGTITTNAATASAWETARTLTLSGDLSGNVSISGAHDITLTATVSGNSITLGTDTTGDYVASVTAGTGITATGTGEGAAVTVALSASGVTANSYGSSTAVPVLTIDTYGRITSASTASVSSSINIAGDTGTDSVSLISDTLTVSGGTGLTSTVTNNTVTLDIDNTVTTLTGSQTLTNKTISGADNTISNIGNASLTNSSITINGTAVSLGGTRTLVTDDVAEDASPVNLWFTDTRARNAISATDAGGDGSFTYDSGTGVFTYTGPSASEVRAHFSGGTGVTITNGEVSIGQAVGTSSNVTFNDVIVSGNLTVSGTTTTINTETLNLADNIVVFNSNETGTPSQDAGIEIERGTSPNVSLLWDETNDRWTIGSQNFLANTFIGALSGNATTATTWATGRTIALTGDVTGTSAAFDGSGNLSFATTLANSGVTAGTFTKVTVDAKGRVTTGASLASGDLPTYTGTLTSSQVTTALGYTPYNATNPNGYTTNTGTVTSVSGTGTASGLTLSGTVTTSGNLTLSGTVNTVAASGAAGIQNSYQASINTTTPGQGTYGIHFNGQTTADFAAGITWNGGTTTTNANAGIYVQGSGSYGTKMYFATTDSYASGSKTALSIDHSGNIYVVRGNVGINTTDFSYTQSDNTPVVGSRTNNKLFVSGSIQLLSNDDAIVFGRGSASFFKDEEIGFGWGGGFYMVDGTYLRVRNGSTVQLYSDGIIRADGSMRSVVFYDQNNTAFYLDPASTGTSLNIAGVINTTAPGGSILMRHSVSEVDAWLFMENASNWGLYWKNAPSGQHTFGGYTSVGAELFGMSAANASGNGVLTSNYVGATSAYAQWMLSNYTGYVWSASTVFAAGDMRAPIFYDSNDTGFYLDPNSTGTSLQIAGTIEQGNNFAHPNVEWSSTGATGEVIFYLPGTTSNYGMVHMVFDIYEYNSPRICTVIVGGHNWSSSWYNVACNVIGYTDKAVRLGVKDNRFCVVFGGTSSSWSYGTIRLRKIHNGGYYDNVMNLGGNWSTTITTSESFTSITGDLRGLRTPSTLEVDGIMYGYSSVRSPIFYDNDNTGYYVDPASTARLHYVVSNGGIRIDGNENLYLDYNYGQSIVGVYTSTRYQGVFAMGNSYKLPIDGSSTGSLYGLAWSHPNAGGVAGNLNTHGMLVLENGAFLAAVSGSIRARDDMRTPIFYDSNDTGYYIDPNTTATSINVRGEIRNPSIWINDGDNFNAYNENIRLFNAPNGVSVIAFSASGTSGSPTTSILGFGDRHEVRFNDGWQTRIYNGYAEAAGSYRAPIFYDSNNTGYYVDPNSSSQLSAVFANDWFRAQGSTGLYFQDYGYGLRSAHGEGNSYGNATTYGGGRNGWSGWGIGTRYVFMSDNGEQVGVHDNSRGWIWIWNGSTFSINYGYTTIAGSTRSPIFYDSDDTAWYAEMQSSSRFYRMHFGNNGTPYGMVAILGNIGYTSPASYYYLSSGVGYGQYASGAQGVGLALYTDDGSRIICAEYMTHSDSRLKDVVNEISENEGLSFIRDINPVHYRWKNAKIGNDGLLDRELKTGFIAQDVIRNGFRHLVAAVPKEGLPAETDIYGHTSPANEQFTVDYVQMIPYYHAALKNILNKTDEIDVLKQKIQEQQEKIEELERRINNS